MKVLDWNPWSGTPGTTRHTVWKTPNGLFVRALAARVRQRRQVRCPESSSAPLLKCLAIGLRTGVDKSTEMFAKVPCRTEAALLGNRFD
jgi:hypothetical protein